LERGRVVVKSAGHAGRLFQALSVRAGAFQPRRALIRLPMGGPAGSSYCMWLGQEDALRAHLEALTTELGRLADRLARPGAPKAAESDQIASRLASLQSRLTRAPGSRGGRVRLDALHRLAVVAEDEGWLDAGEAIVLRKLAFRVAFYLRRHEATLP